MSPDPRAAYDAIAAEIAATSPATIGQMFGMPCLKNNGKAFAGFYRGAMVFKLGAPRHADLLTDGEGVDPLSGNVILNGIPVTVEKVR